MALQDRQLDDYYQACLNTLSTNGWSELVKDLQRHLDSVENIETIRTDADLWFRKGQRDILKYVIDLRSLMENAYDELQRQEAEEAALNANPS